MQAELLLSSENSGVEYKLKALITFADSLVDGQEYRRAIVSDYFCYYCSYFCCHCFVLFCAYCIVCACVLY